MSYESGLERLLRTFVAVADRRSFTRAADDLHIAQQAVSQQVKALERALGVTLLRRTPRRVQLTAEGAVFLADSRRVLAAADRAARRVKEAARGEVGTLRLAYTLTTVWDTIPKLLSHMAEVHPQLKVEAREVFGADIPESRARRAIRPRNRTHDLLPARIPVPDRPPRTRPHRAERTLTRWRSASASGSPRWLTGRSSCGRVIWLPGFYDAVVGTCRAAGFDSTIDEQATGNTVWGNIARGRGVALINASLSQQLPRGIRLVEALNSRPRR